MEHLWTGAEAPPDDYIDLILCRDLYHCPPDVLDRQEAQRVQAHLECVEAEAQVAKQRNRQRRA